jgi:hypothetical protein
MSRCNPGETRAGSPVSGQLTVGAKLKVTDEHRAQMRDAIRVHVHELFAAGLPHREAQWLSSGHSARRYRWDIARGAKLIPFMTNTLYRYANDTHIDTALRAIVRELELGEGK